MRLKHLLLIPAMLVLAAIAGKALPGLIYPQSAPLHFERQPDPQLNSHQEQFLP